LIFNSNLSRLLALFLCLCMIANFVPITEASENSEESSSPFLEEEITSGDIKSEPQLVVANVTPDPIPVFSDVKKGHCLVLLLWNYAWNR